jgi:hypothetical protein
MRRREPFPLWIPILAGAGLGAAIGLVAVETTCAALFGEVSWGCRVDLFGWTLTPSVGETLAKVLLAILGAAIGLLLPRLITRKA